MKGLLFLILLIAFNTNSHASCFIQDIHGNCIQQSQYSAPQTVQQTYEPVQQVPNAGWERSQSNNNSAGSGITLSGILIIWLVVSIGTLLGMFGIRNEYLRLHNYEIFDWINIAILTGFNILAWFVGFNLAFRLGLGTIWPGFIFTIVIGVIIAFTRINKQMGKRGEAIVALILQFLLSASAAFLAFLLYALFSRSRRE